MVVGKIKHPLDPVRVYRRDECERDMVRVLREFLKWDMREIERKRKRERERERERE